MALRKSKKGFFSHLGKKPGKYIQTAALCVLVLMGIAHLRAAFLSQLAMNKGAQMGNFSSTLTQPDALAYLARNEHLTNGNLARAFTLYQRGLSFFVLDISSWLGMVEIYNDMGERDKAGRALQHVESIPTPNADIAWTKALLAHELDLEDILAANLLLLVRNYPAKQRDAFSLANLRWQDPEILLRLFGPASNPDLLGYFIGINEAEKAGKVWQQMEAGGDFPPEATLLYINFLLRRDDVPEAGRIWRSRYQTGESLLSNPDLKEPFTRSGFGWQISQQEGVSWQPLPGGNGLEIRFDSTANPSFSLAQTVPLDPGPYSFTGFFSTDGLTTDQLPYWSVNGYKCDGLRLKDAMLPPTSDRQPFRLDFTVPESCSAVRLALQRNTSFFFDNKINGSVSIDSLRIAAGQPAEVTAQAESAPEPASRQPQTAKQPAPVSSSPDPAPSRVDTTDIRINKMIVK